MVCIRCQKRPAIIFIQRMVDGQMKQEGYCLHCARELHIKPVDDLMKQFGMSDQDLDGAVDLAVTADDIIQFAFPRLAGQVLTIGIQEFAFGGLFAVLAVGALFVAVLFFTAGKAQREGGIAAGDQIFVLVGGILAALGHVHHHRPAHCHRIWQPEALGLLC